jgi:exosortase
MLSALRRTLRGIVLADSIRSINAWRPEICFGVCLASLSPLLVVQALHLWDRPHLQFFPLAWLAVIVLISKRSKLKWTTSLWRSRFGTAAWGLGLAAGITAALFYSPWMGQVAAILCIMGWGSLRLETPWIRWIGWTLLLWITLPLPSGLDAGFVNGLQQVSAKSAGALLDLFGIAHLRQGTLIEIRSRKLFVDEACSGIDSLYSLTAISLLMMLWQRRPLIVGLLTIVSVPIWAWLGNVVRLIVIVVLLDRWQIDVSEGFKHTLLGLVTFALSSVCLFLTLSAFTELFERFYPSAMPRHHKQWHLWYNVVVSFPGKAPVIKDEEEAYFAGPDVATKAPRPAKRNQAIAVPRPTHAAVLLAFGLCTLAILVISIRSIERDRRLGNAGALPHFELKQVRQAFGETSFPEKLQQAQRVGFEQKQRSPDSFFGEYSRIWSYRDARSDFVLSIDFPFRGYHPLWVCYTNAGNEVQGKPTPVRLPSQATLSETSPSETPPSETPRFDTSSQGAAEPTAMFVKLKDELGSHSYLWFLLFEANGTPVKIKDYDGQNAENPLLDRIKAAFAESVAREPVTYQFQLYVPSNRELSSAELDEYLHLFDASLPFARQQVKALTSQE